MANQVNINDAMIIEIREASINGRKLPMAIITYLETLITHSENEILAIVGQGYEKAAELISMHPHYADTKSVILIINGMQTKLTPELIKQWHSFISENDVATQAYFKEIFHRPVLMISAFALPLELKKMIQNNLTKINPSSENSWFVESLDEAIALGEKMMSLVHRN